MRTGKLENMVKGWFVGNFNPTLIATNDVEVAIKNYKAGAHEASHHHKIATELTAVISGEIEMNGIRYFAGDIVVVDPGESATFRAITDTVNVVVKHPGASNDKYVD